jgi:ADP-ribose pyrophosphatase
MKRRVEILDEQTVYEKRFFRLVEAHLRHELYDGSMSEELTRISFERGDSATVILHDPDNGAVVLVEQFRFPTYRANKTGSGWLLELPAGVIEKSEGDAVDATVKRELLEETDYIADELTFVSTFFASPGASSERLSLFYGTIHRVVGAYDGGGVASEGEDIRTLVIPLEEALGKITSGEIADAKTIIGLQWLHLKLLTQPAGR